MKYSAKLVEYLTKSVSKGSFWHLGPISSNTSNISNFPSPVSSKQVQEKAKLMTDEFWDMMGERPKGNIAEQSMNKPSKAFKHYPTKSEVDSWIEDLRQQAGSINCEVERKSEFCDGKDVRQVQRISATGFGWNRVNERGSIHWWCKGCRELMHGSYRYVK